MLKRRRWTGAGFRRLVGHPLNRQIARRLVWGVYSPSGVLTGAVRVAEDFTLATVDDDEITLADDTIVGVAHHLELGDSLSRWAEVFADYEIMQPFRQLARESHAPTAEEVAAGRLLRFEGADLPDWQARQLEYRGWHRDLDQIVFDGLGRLTAVVVVQDGRIGRVQLSDEHDPVSLSDVIRHLSEVTP